MRFYVKNILKQMGEDLEIEAFEPIKGLSDCAEGYKILDPVKMKGKLTNLGGRINLKADVAVKYQTECGRCLEPVIGTMEISLDEEFVPNARFNSEFNAGFDAAKDDSGEYHFDGDWVDIDSAIIDTIVVALPISLLCSEDCKGLCPECGNNLNKQACSCAENATNPAMAKLKNFFNN